MQKHDVVRIGTRKSKLALWQANLIKNKIEDLGLEAELVLINSIGDTDKTTDLHQFSQTGIFTKSLDLALLKEEIHMAVHSLKDYPTVPHEKIAIHSIGKREDPRDVLVKNTIEYSVADDTFIIGTGSIRRRAQWKFKYPNTTFSSLRGNVPTRLEKLYDSEWDGIIMALAGMERLDLVNENCVPLDWMLPAPAQGTLGVTYLKNDEFTQKISEQLKDEATDLCAEVERKFLNLLEGGCSAPIGALAVIKGDTLYFKGSLHAPDGSEGYLLKWDCRKEEALDKVKDWVEEILEQGGYSIMQQIKSN